MKCTDEISKECVEVLFIFNCCCYLFSISGIQEKPIDYGSHLLFNGIMNGLFPYKKTEHRVAIIVIKMPTDFEFYSLLEFRDIITM